MASLLRQIVLVSALTCGAVVLAPGESLQRAALAHSDGHGHSEGHGQGHSQDFAAGVPGDPGEAHRVVTIVMSEGPGTMTYNPERIEVRKGERIKLVLRNAGQLPHELVLDTPANNARHKAEMEKSPDMAHDEPNGRRLDPGQSAELLWRFTKAGTFEYACLIPGHYEAGMKGIVVVK
jgi:uncharacterized cupredoxin-like copper-binding protein